MADFGEEFLATPETFESKTFKATNNFIMKRFGFIGVTLVSLAFMFWGFFSPAMSGKTIWDILLTSGISMLVAYSIDTLLRLQGILAGALDNDVVQAKHKHIEAASDANAYVNWSDDWAEEENKLSLKMARTHLLTTAGLRYIDFFDADGDLIETAVVKKPTKDSPPHIIKRYKTKLAAIDNAVKFKITPVTMARLSAETTANLDYNNTGLEPSQYQSKQSRNALITKALSGSLFGLVVINVATGSGWSNFYYGAIQVALYLVFGFISYFLSYTYMTGAYLSGLRKKTNLLRKLISYGKKKELELNKHGN